MEDLVHDQLSPTSVLVRLILIMLWKESRVYTESPLAYVWYTIETRRWIKGDADVVIIPSLVIFQVIHMLQVFDIYSMTIL